MKKGNLTREQAVAIAGETLVAAAEDDNAEYTGRVGYNGSTHGDDFVEFSGSAQGDGVDGEICIVVVYYYQDADAHDAHADDLSALDWIVSGYEIV